MSGRLTRSSYVPAPCVALVLLLSLLTIAAITSLQRRSAAGRDAQITLGQVDRALVQVQVDPFIAMDAFGGDPARARAATKADQRKIQALLNSLRRQGEPAQVEAARGAAAQVFRRARRPAADRRRA